VGTLGNPSCEQEALAQLLEVRRREPGHRQQGGGVLAEEMTLQVGCWPADWRGGAGRAVSMAFELQGAAGRVEVAGLQAAQIAAAAWLRAVARAGVGGATWLARSW
jgi:hypothetical protein